MNDCPSLAHLCRLGEGQSSASAMPRCLSLLRAVGAVGDVQPSGRDTGGGCLCACPNWILFFFFGRYFLLLLLLLLLLRV